MNGERLSLDTNLLVYAVDRDAGERHERATQVVSTAAREQNCVLPLQALSEFFAAVTCKGKMPAAEAAAQVEDWMILFPTVPTSGAGLQRALRAVRTHSLPFWGALLWATVPEAGATTLLSEDFQDDRVLEGVRFSNPFR